MGRKTYTYRTTSFVIGALILLFLLLLALSFVAGYYAGEAAGRREAFKLAKVKTGTSPQKVEGREIKTPSVPKTAPSPAEIPPSKKQPTAVNSSEKKTVPSREVKPSAPIRSSSIPEKTGEYYLQVAALRNSSSARRLASDLGKRGFPSKVEPTNGFYRVLVGPYELNEAKAVREKIFPVLKKLRVRLRSAREILIRRRKK